MAVGSSPRTLTLPLLVQQAGLGLAGASRTQLAKGKSLADIAEFLNRKGVPPAHGTNRWTAAMVRKAYVS